MKTAVNRTAPSICGAEFADDRRSIDAVGSENIDKIKLLGEILVRQEREALAPRLLVN